MDRRRNPCAVELTPAKASMNQTTEGTHHEPLAIVGIGCRFPGGADSAERFWDLLCSETDATRTVPETRWDATRYHDPNPGKVGKIVTRRGGFLERDRPVRPAVLRHLPARSAFARPAATAPSAGDVGGLRGRGDSRRHAGGHRRRRLRRRVHPRLSTPTESGHHQPIPIQGPLGHRHDDDDAGQPASRTHSTFADPA